jgi:multidrug efflux pump subunit AcrA (membrane-fusion protein)
MIGQESIFAQTKKGKYIPTKFDTIKKAVPQQVYGNPKAQRRADSLARIKDSLDRLAVEAQKQEEARLAEIRRKEEAQRQQNNRAEQKAETTKSGKSNKKENRKKQVNEAENRKALEEKARLNQMAEDAAAEARKRKPLRSQWTLEDCVLYAKENNLSVAENALNERLAKLVLEQNKVSRLPNVNADFSLGESYGRSIDPTSNQFVTKGFLYNTTGLSSQVLVFGWFQKKYQIEQSQLDLYASEYAFKQLKEDIALNVATGFLRVLLARSGAVRANPKICTKWQVAGIKRSPNAGAGFE